MATHKLSFDDFEDEDFSLIAIYTPLEDYLLAYAINNSCIFRLKRAAEDLSFSTSEQHPLFEFEDQRNGYSFALLKNKSEIIPSEESGELFNFTKIGYLLPEFNRADFFLKIEPQNDVQCKELLRNLTKIEKVTTLQRSDLKGGGTPGPVEREIRF